MSALLPKSVESEGYICAKKQTYLTNNDKKELNIPFLFSASIFIDQL